MITDVTVFVGFDIEAEVCFAFSSVSFGNYSRARKNKCIDVISTSVRRYWLMVDVRYFALLMVEDREGDG